MTRGGAPVGEVRGGWTVSVTLVYYMRRWGVEDFFRVVKSGCRAEHLGFLSTERLQRALTIQAIIACRTLVGAQNRSPSTTAPDGRLPYPTSAPRHGRSRPATASSDGRRSCPRRTSPSRGRHPEIPHPVLNQYAQSALAHSRPRLPATAQDWTERYNATPVLIDTFVETPRYTGTV